MIEYKPYNRLSDDRNEAMRMMAEIESICGCLPGTDCGSCGAPTCMAFAEDIVKGETNADECTVNMRMLFHQFLNKRKEGVPADAFPADKCIRNQTPKTGEEQ